MSAPAGPQMACCGTNSAVEKKNCCKSTYIYTLMDHHIPSEANRKEELHNSLRQHKLKHDNMLGGGGGMVIQAATQTAPYLSCKYIWKCTVEAPAASQP